MLKIANKCIFELNPKHMNNNLANLFRFALFLKSMKVVGDFKENLELIEQSIRTPPTFSLRI